MKYKKAFSVPIFIFISISAYLQNREGLFQTNKVRSGSVGYEIVSLELNKDNKFKFKDYNDQSDYVTEKVAHGNYTISENKLNLFLADDIRPIVSVIKNNKNYIKFDIPKIPGLYMQVFNKEGKQLKLLDISTNTMELSSLDTIYKARIFYNQYDIANLIIDEPCDVHVSNVESDIAYYVETYSFSIKPKKIVGKLEFYWWSEKAFKRKLVFYKKD